MAMYNPEHPGELVSLKFIKDEDGGTIDSVANVAKKLNVHRSTLNRLIKQVISVTPEMEIALERNGGGSAEHWLTMQNNYDLFKLRNSSAA